MCNWTKLTLLRRYRTISINWKHKKTKENMFQWPVVLLLLFLGSFLSHFKNAVFVCWCVCVCVFLLLLKFWYPVFLGFFFNRILLSRFSVVGIRTHLIMAFHIKQMVLPIQLTSSGLHNFWFSNACLALSLSFSWNLAQNKFFLALLLTSSFDWFQLSILNFWHPLTKINTQKQQKQEQQQQQIKLNFWEDRWSVLEHFFFFFSICILWTQCENQNHCQE